MILILGLTMALGLLGCSGKGAGPLLPDGSGTDMGTTQGMSIAPDSEKEGSHSLWGLWSMHLNADHTQVDAEPLRSANFHLNVVGYLEHTSQLLKVTKVSQSDHQKPADRHSVDPSIHEPDLYWL